MRVQHCSIPTRRMSNTSETAAGIVIATHSSGKFGLVCNGTKLQPFNDRTRWAKLRIEEAMPVPQVCHPTCGRFGPIEHPPNADPAARVSGRQAGFRGSSPFAQQPGPFVRLNFGDDPPRVNMDNSVERIQQCEQKSFAGQLHRG